MIQQSIIQKIVEAIEAERALFAGSDNQFAKKLGISNSQYSNIKNGKTDRQLAPKDWQVIMGTIYNASGKREFDSLSNQELQALSFEFNKQRKAIEALEAPNG